MAKRKDPNQKGSGARKHRRNYRMGMVGRYNVEGKTTKYRARHYIADGPRKVIHREGRCPVHSQR